MHATGRVSAPEAALTSERVRFAPAAISRRRHDATDVDHGRPHQRACDRDHDRSPDRAGVGRDRGRRPCRRATTPTRLSPPCGPCSPKTTTAPHSPRAARGRIESASRSPTRSRASRSGRRRGSMTALRLTIGITTRESAGGAPALPAVDRRRGASVAGSPRVRRRLLHTGERADRCAGRAACRPRPPRRPRARRISSAATGWCAGLGAGRVPDGRRRGDRSNAEAIERATAVLDADRQVAAIAFAQSSSRRAGGTKGCSRPEPRARATWRRSSALRTCSAATCSPRSADTENRS